MSEQREDPLDEMGNLSIALPPEAWQELLMEAWRPWPFAWGARSAIRAVLVRAGYSPPEVGRGAELGVGG